MPDFLKYGGPGGALIRAFEWSAHPLGEPAAWPTPLQTLVGVMLNAEQPMFVAWGAERRLIYNAAYAPILGARHPDALGRPFFEVWSELQDQVEPLMDAGFAGTPTHMDDIALTVLRNGYPETAHFAFSYTPVRDERGKIVGVFCACRETTDEVANRSRERFLLDLERRLKDLGEARAIVETAQAALGEHLRASRVGYGDVDATERWFTTERNWTDGSVPHRSGTHDLAGFGEEVHGALRAGATLAIGDVSVDPRTIGTDVARAFEAIDTRAAMTVSLIKEGRFTSALSVHDRTPRVWTPTEIRTAEEVAERTWAAVERARAEKALQAFAATLETQVAERTAERDRIWRLSPDLMLVAGFDSTIVAVNPAWTNRLGWSEEELVGRSYLDFVDPEHTRATAEETERLADGQRTFRFENRYRHKEGGWRWISWTAAPDEQFIHAVGRDVTEEKAQAVALEAAQEQLRQAQKMEAVGQLTGGVAHDFNNLLTVIRSSADLLRRGDLSDDRRRRYIDAIAETADRAAKLTGQLLAFARRQALKPERFDAAERVRGISDMLRTIVGSRVRLSIEVADAPAFVEADAAQFETALVNMAVNARDAMDGEGALTIAVAAEDDRVRIRVSDTGQGVPPEHLERIFEPFFTTKPVGKGTGLGLSQVYGFAKQSGGEVEVESLPGEGTTFVFYLPRAEAPAGPDEISAPAVTPVGRGRVLVVEDNPQVGEFATQLLADLGYETRLAPNAEAALETLETTGAAWDAVFTDVVMPGMGGVELARLVRRRWPDLPVVLTSGYSHVLAEDARHGFPLLHKPYSVEDLSESLRQAMRQPA